MTWTKKKLDKETKEMQIKSNEEVEELGLVARKSGRPNKSTTVKTNLDLSPELINDLDSIAEYMGAARQAVIKGFILAGINDHYKSQSKKKKAS